MRALRLMRALAGLWVGISCAVSAADPVVTVTASDDMAGEPGSEYGRGTFTLTRTGSTAAGLTVNYSIGGTATGGQDYNSLFASVTFSPGSGTVTKNVTIIDDSAEEDHEMVIMTLSSGTGYTVGAQSSATVLIEDDDTPPRVEVLIQTLQPATESAPLSNPPVFQFFRFGSQNYLMNSLTVAFTVGGTATSGSDFQPLGSLTFGPGSTQVSKTLVAIDDSTVENAETVLVTLVPGAGYRLSLFNKAEVLIMDNDTRVAVTASDALAGELGVGGYGWDRGSFKFTRSGSTAESLTVYFTVGGTATSGSDFTSLGTEVTFAAGSATATRIVEVRTDTALEGSETVVVTLSSGYDYTVDSPPSATVRIRDDELAWLPNDYDGNWLSDLAIFDTSGGYWYVQSLSGKTLTWQNQWGWSTAKPVPGDYDGDGRADLAVFDTVGGYWYVKALSGSTLAWKSQWGWSTAKPVPGDYNGDGAWDQAVFDTVGGYWYVRTLGGTTLAWKNQWGWSGAKPVAGDYNGDGTWDQAVFDTAGGYWYVKTLGGTTLAWKNQWGWSTAIPVPGDYDGDGVFDQAVFDSANGYWYIKTLGGRSLAWAVQWGWSGAKPISGDFDGDGIYDLAVFNTANGRWFIKSLDGRILGWDVNWGWAGALAPSLGD